MNKLIIILSIMLIIGCTDDPVSTSLSVEEIHSAFYWCEVIADLEYYPDHYSISLYDCNYTLTLKEFFKSKFFDECKYRGFCNYNHQ